MYYTMQFVWVLGVKEDSPSQNIGYPTTLEIILFFSGLVSVVVFRMVFRSVLRLTCSAMLCPCLDRGDAMASEMSVVLP